MFSLPVFWVTYGYYREKLHVNHFCNPFNSLGVQRVTWKSLCYYLTIVQNSKDTVTRRDKITCIAKQLDGVTHDQTIVCKQQFAIH